MIYGEGKYGSTTIIRCLMIRFFMCMGSFFLLSVSQAGVPLWTFTPLTATKVSVSVSGTAIIQYIVTNQSRKSHTLVMAPITGISQITGGSCDNPFILGPQKSCTLTLQVTGRTLQGNVVGGPVVCQQGNLLQCYQPSASKRLNIKFASVPSETTLAASIPSLALQTSGVARIITITNTGTDIATNVTYSLSPSLPAGTTIMPASCGTLAPAGTCVLTITPGATPSAMPGDTNPTPISLTISGDNTNTLTPTINILTYGSVYQSGFIFNIDDTTPNSGSIGGTVAALIDQVAPAPNGIIWSSNGNGGTSADAAFDAIPGIYQNSSTPLDACNGNLDGACNTRVIVNFYPAVNLNFYAAGFCKETISGYTDWYLPAICEMGYDSLNIGTTCGTQAVPISQNMQSNLVNNGNIGGLAGSYWGSTEDVFNIPTNSFFQDFTSGNQGSGGKNFQIGVRCVRAISVS
ncbi:DUF1566 domain-containing protein [Legionella maioricensis]|uniref:DUF1566 domain-containing protein n=1 Tax=Legionella maioricensis TaxID=2896528 RepID=A0A9X2D1K5_9GAMM|nr:DUF1566 domain-containing protein [Legionella maioricensis]MCL9684617.1 DUF1566 domain-containing protein [Legionella maioricensis]MCL9687397.1 DUF1566 domain-containing protein [Legionella maioricensis]